MKAISEREAIYFLGGKRTAFGTFQGSLKDLSATDLAVETATAALSQAAIDAAQVEHVIYGNVMQTSRDAIYLSRHVGLKVGVKTEVGALTVNRLCGSGFQAFVSAAQMMLTEGTSLVLAGGTESMSQAPHVIRDARSGLSLGKSALEDTIVSGLFDTHVNLPMGETAENLAKEFKITQAEVDAFSILSQQRHAAAQQAKRFEQEIVGLTLSRKKEKFVFDADEHPRPETTLEKLARLPKVFRPDGVIHAGAASGINDGAASAVLATGAFCEKTGKKPIGRLLNWAVTGCDPKIMGIGPVSAIQALLARADISLKDVDLFEVNEAFAPQYLAVEKALQLPREKTNVDGGAIAVGHPLAASGARITVHLLYSLKSRGLKYGIGSACIGGGQGIAVLVEAL
jgi:acetyl-CoA acyltransferase 2